MFFLRTYLGKSFHCPPWWNQWIQRGSSCDFLDEMIFPSTFFKKTDFSTFFWYFPSSNMSTFLWLLVWASIYNLTNLSFNRGNITGRIVWTLFINILVFVFTIVLAMVDTSEWPNIFFYLTIGSVVVLNSK